MTRCRPRFIHRFLPTAADRRDIGWTSDGRCRRRCLGATGNGGRKGQSSPRPTARRNGLPSPPDWRCATEKDAQRPVVSDGSPRRGAFAGAARRRLATDAVSAPDLGAHPACGPPMPRSKKPSPAGGMNDAITLPSGAAGAGRAPARRRRAPNRRHGGVRVGEGPATLLDRALRRFSISDRACRSCCRRASCVVASSCRSSSVLASRSDSICRTFSGSTFEGPRRA